jgi:hypothetical protein
MVNCQLHVRGATPTKKSPAPKRLSGTHSRSEHGEEEKYPRIYRESNFGCPAHRIVTILTELSRLPFHPKICLNLNSAQCRKSVYSNFTLGERTPEDHWLQGWVSPRVSLVPCQESNCRDMTSYLEGIRDSKYLKTNGNGKY